MVNIDTLSYAKRLESAGVPRQQAEAHAEAMRAEVTPQMATKADLDTAVVSLRGEIALLRKDMDAAIAQLRAEFNGKFALLQWMLAANITISLAVLWKLLK